MRPFTISVLIALALAGCDRQKAPEPQAKPAAAAPAPAYRVDRAQAGKAMPAIPIQDAAEAPATLTAFRGKPLLVNLWATWCIPCIRELPTLDALAASGRVKVLAVSQDMEGRRVVAPFLAKRGFKALPGYLDRENALMMALKEAELPVTILFGADGKEVWRVKGGLDWTGPEAAKLLAEGGVA